MKRAAGVLGRLAARLFRLYGGTLRFCLLYPDGTVRHSPFDHPFGSEIFALCERDTVAIGFGLTAGPFTTLVARGRDGDLACALLEGLGTRTVRGSTRRGGVGALKALVDVLSDRSVPAALVVDGPLGPAGVAKPGILFCGRRTGRPVWPVGSAARPRLHLPGTWSGLYIPLPYSRVAIALEEPLGPDAGEGAAEELTRRLAAARQRAEHALDESAAWAAVPTTVVGGTP